MEPTPENDLPDEKLTPYWRGQEIIGRYYTFYDDVPAFGRLISWFEKVKDRQDLETLSSLDQSQYVANILGNAEQVLDFYWRNGGGKEIPIDAKERFGTDFGRSALHFQRSGRFLKDFVNVVVDYVEDTIDHLPGGKPELVAPHITNFDQLKGFEKFVLGDLRSWNRDIIITYPDGEEHYTAEFLFNIPEQAGVADVSYDPATRALRARVTEPLEVTNDRSQEFWYLPESDQQLLYQSGKEILKKFLGDFPDRLPDVLIFPDTSARPLYYLLRPIIEQIAKSRGQNLPRIYFYATDKLTGQERLQIDNVARPQNRDESISAKKERVVEILDEVRKSIKEDRPPTIVAFDDFISRGVTYDSLKENFGLDIPLYVFLGQQDQQSYQQQGKSIKTGMLDPTDRDSFAYRHKGGIGIKKIRDMTAEFKYSKAQVNPTTSGKVEALRHDMGRIGEKILIDLELK